MRGRSEDTLKIMRKEEAEEEEVKDVELILIGLGGKPFTIKHSNKQVL